MSLKSCMSYKGYLGVISYDDDDKVFHGRVINAGRVITFKGKSVADLERTLQDSVEGYLAFCAEQGRPPEKPFSGRFLVRTDPGVHRRAALAAKLEGLSLNAWAAEVLSREADKRLEA